ncbi:MAG: MBL fold metallo-hydrolase [Prevotella sp.]|nr:MBL fold metallo-hydrolase [Prevotella sp.]
MIEVQRFTCNMLQENCYIVSDDTKECVIIDCGAYYEEERLAVIDEIRANSLTPTHLLCTHGHLDHNFGNDLIYREFNLKPEVSKADGRMMENLKRQALSYYGLQLDGEMPEVEHYLEPNETVRFGTHQLQVMATPGHSRGSVVFYCEQENAVFTGDTLFERSIGRTDLDGGSMMQIIQSLRMLAQLPDETVVYPGHGPQTTIGKELSQNPFLDR